MMVQNTDIFENTELPFRFILDFGKLYPFYQLYAGDNNREHPYHVPAKKVIQEIEKTPELINGISDLYNLERYRDQIDLLLDPLFPEALLLNEIKAACFPLSFTTFKTTTRFENILKAAGNDFQLRLRGFEDDLLYVYACTMILGMVYNYPVNLKRPFFFDIPDEDGTIRNYRVAFNVDLSEIVPTESAPEITEEDIKILIDSFDNVEIWKEKFPPDSYILKGFGIMNLFDVTHEEIISDIRSDLLRSNDDLVQKLEKHLRKFYGIDDLSFGFSILDVSSQDSIKIKKSKSRIMDTEEMFSCDGYFCDGVLNKVFRDRDFLAISDVEKYGKETGKNLFYQRLVSEGIGSIILVPILDKCCSDLAVLEITSPRPYELNSLNQNKLKDIIPVFESYLERATREHQNVLEAIVQEHYTSIHPSVKWRFNEAAEKYLRDRQKENQEIQLDEIIFDGVFPFYGQADIKGSSAARNEAIKEDLLTQLDLAVNVLQEACRTEKLPIYEELTFQVNEYTDNIKAGLKAGDEVGILDFLQSEIYPAFNHIKKLSKKLAKLIDAYSARLDPEINAIYEKRKEYEKSVALLNEKLSKYLDARQEDAQSMFPHYFERFQTDGVEFNMYIGQSLVRDGKFEPIYLYNLRLWQLQVMHELENVAYLARNEMQHDLRITSLILVQNNPMAIKFKMDEKQFDANGAYNIRYEIIKKRIDKAHIKNTKERLTVPGKIAIVYSQEKDAQEYMKYIRFLQSRKLFGEVEQLELEELQGLSGLKALRVEVIYNEDFAEESKAAIDELMEEIQT